VTAIDLSATLVNLARERVPHDLGAGSIDFSVGDMTDPALGKFDHVVGMDSLIHYRAPDMSAVVERLAAMASRSLVFTFAPRTPVLAVMHASGKLFPRSDRAPAIEPIGARDIARRIARNPAMEGWSLGRSRRIDSFFYISQGQELVRA
jgi:magnesium-protoporphyrin O-methyltransferase